MPRACTVCTNPKRRDIDAALTGGSASNRRIAAQFGVSEQAIRRHHKEHVPASLAQAAKAAEVTEATTLLEQVSHLRDRSLRLLSRAEDAGDLRTALQGIREARACVELLAEVEGKLDRRTTVNIAMSTDWIEIRSVLLTSLEPFPEARQQVVGSLLALEGRVTSGH